MLTAGQQVTRYQLDERVEEDPLTETWRASFTTTSVPRLLRVARTEATPFFDEWTRLLRHQQRIAHPTRTDVIDLIKIDGRPTAVTDLRKGPSLATWSRARPRKVGELVGLFYQLVSSLRIAHRAGLIHGAIEARRIVMSNERGPFIPRLDLAYGQIAAALPLGIPAPEQQSGRSLDERSDLFQLGTVLYEMFVRAPFGGGRQIAEARPDAPPAVLELADGLLANDPSARPASCLDVLAALDPLRDLGPHDVPIR